MGIYRIISRLVPSFLSKRLKSFYAYSNIKIEFENFLGFVTLVSFLIGVVAGFYLSLYFRQSFWIFFFSFSILTGVSVYLWLVFLVDKKASLIEDALPDALQLMASNLRAGMTPDKALLLSSRPEFGPLKVEIDIVGRKVALGKGIGSSLMEMANRVKSKRLLRAVELINSGLNSGGSLAVLLEATANHLREQFLVDKKIKASITMYSIFIFSASSMIAPILLALSSFLVEILKSTFSSVNIPSNSVSSIPIQAAQITISNEFLMFIILAFLIINCLMASMLLGLIGKGKKRDGVKYFIPMILLALPIFFIVRAVISGVLGGLFTF
jgi:pilus assembly protein TadC